MFGASGTQRLEISDVSGACYGELSNLVARFPARQGRIGVLATGVRREVSRARRAMARAASAMHRVSLNRDSQRPGARSARNARRWCVRAVCPSDLIGVERRLERVRGIEPPSSAWEAEVLPLNNTRRCLPILGPKCGLRQAEFDRFLDCVSGDSMRPVDSRFPHPRGQVSQGNGGARGCHLCRRTAGCAGRALSYR